MTTATSTSLLETPRLRLRAPEPSDINTFMRWENDTHVWECGSTIAPLSRHQLLEYLRNYSADIVTERQLRLVAQTGCDVVGAVDLFDYDPVNSRAMLGLIVDEAHRRHGYATEMLALIAGYCRRRLSLHQLWAIVAADNTPSLRTFIRAGFTQSSILTDWLRRDGKFVDALLLRLELKSV